jgi:hypothetical protein
MLTMSTEESTVSRDKKTPIEISEEIKTIRSEIIYYIENYLQNVHLKGFKFGKEKYAPFVVLRQFRMMCLMFQRRLKKYNLDPRGKLLVFFGQKCSMCGKTENLEIHHRFKDGKNDRSTFEDYEVFMWTYYLIHLEEAYERLRVLCNECHDDAHNGSGIGDLFGDVMEMFGF